MMRLVAPLLISLAATLVCAIAGRRIRPKLAAHLISSAIASVFVCLAVSAWVVAFEFLAHERLTGPFFAWCRQALALHRQPPLWIGLPALGLALWTTIQALRIAATWRRQRGFGASRVHLINTATPLAFTQTGRHAGVVVSTGMLAALDDAEQGALFSHEQSHLAHRHDRYIVLASLAGSLPVLAPAVGQLRLALERWADEDAAEAVGDRTIVARAVAKAALVSHDRQAAALGMATSHVPARVEALLRPPVSGASFVAAATFAAVATAVVMASIQLHQLTFVFAAICPG